MIKRAGHQNNANCRMIVLIAILVITVTFAGCSEQKDQKTQSVSGIPGLQVSLEKNLSVRQYVGSNSDGSQKFYIAPFYYVTFVFTNTGDKPINLKDYLFVLAAFDPKTNTYVERFMAPQSFNLRPNLGPGASYRADPRDNGVFVNYNCGGDAEKFRFIIKKPNEVPVYPPPPPTTLYSMDYFILGDDCNNLELYHNMGLDPAAYQKYMDGVKSQMAVK